MNERLRWLIAYAWECADVLIAVSALVAIGVGLWWIEPAWSLVVVGGLVLCLTVAGLVLRRAK